MSIDNQLVNRQPVNILSVLEIKGLRENMVEFLDPQSISRFRRTCKAGDEVGKSERIWNEVLQREGLERREGFSARISYNSIHMKNRVRQRISGQISNFDTKTEQSRIMTSLFAAGFLVGSVFVIWDSSARCLNEGFARMVQSHDPIQGIYDNSPYMGDCLVKTFLGDGPKLFSAGIVTGLAGVVFKCFNDCRKGPLRRKLNELDQT